MKPLAVVPFYSPKEEGRGFLETLETQTVPVDILVVDNSRPEVAAQIRQSLDRTMRRKRGMTWITPRGATIHYLERPDNPGPGAAFALGLTVARRLGYSHAWFLDQDMVPKENCLEQLLAVPEIRQGLAAGTPARFNPVTGYAYRTIRYGRFRQYSFRGNRTFTPTDVDVTVYSGFLLPMQMAAPNLIPPDYFIDWDDIVMCIRLRKRGGRILFVPAAKADHESGNQRKGLLSRLGFAVGTWRAFRYYYIMRNQWYYGREFGDWRNSTNWRRRVLGQVILLVVALTIEKHRKMVLVNSWRGFVDGRRGLTGKQPGRALGSPQ